jgi:hypothetical protein
MTTVRVLALSVIVFLVPLSVWGGSPEHHWSQSFGDVNVDGGIAIAADAGGNTFVTGRFRDTVNFGGGDLVSAGGPDIFLVKFDANGLHQWSKSFGDTSADYGISLAVNASGDVVVTGYFTGTVNFGGSDLTTPSAAQDIFLAKYDADGGHRSGGVVSTIGNREFDGRVPREA